MDFIADSNFSLSSFNYIGSGPLYAGHLDPSNPTDSSTLGIRVKQSKNFGITDPYIMRVANGIDVSQVPTWQDGGYIRGGKIYHCYRGVWLHETGEGVFISETNVSDCVFGVVVDSGNNNLSNGQTTKCSVGLLVSGGTNNAHGSVMGWNSRHNTYNLSCQNVTLGHYFGGCNFIGGQAGSDNGGIQIYNSKGILISGGQIAYANITVDATSQLTLRDVTFRGPVNITVATGGSFDAKGCVAMSGSTLTYNGTTFSGNN